ncbi:phoenix [Thunnus maccoyii]|uniref:phoenix n=1 Tax=Thunnus maccoyii TaxID=8240 RepID=UPI001C4BD3AF|nr:phoenix [Thunnus maccoyii]
MKAGHHPVKRSGLDAITEVSSQSCHFVLETSPPDYVEKISRFLESSVGQSRQDPEANDSDSGDSLFLTQKSVPEAVRSRRRRHSTLRSDPTSPRDLEDGEDSCFAPHREDGRERREKKYRLPKYSFPFLTERKGKPKSNLLFVQQNTRLHNFGMGGFFKCVRELWQSYQRGDNLESSLLTVDVDGEEIPPLSEGEEEKSDDEDIKVVERKRFVLSSKAKCPQPLNTPQKRHNHVKQQRKRRRASNASQEMSQGRQWKMLHKMPAKGSISRVTLSPSDTESTDDGASSCRAESRKSDEHIKSGRNIVAQTEMPKTKRCKRNLFYQNAGEEELHNDSDATSPVEYTQLDREVSVTVTADVSHIDDPSQTGQPEDESGTRERQDLLQSPPHLIRDTNGDESRVKKRKKEKGEHGGKDKLPEAQHAATSEDVEITDADSPALQAGGKLEINENNQMENSLHDDNTLRQEGERSVEDGVNEREIPPLKQKKKKRNKNKVAVENSGQEDKGGNLECDVRMEEDSVFSESCNVVSDGTEKKKKKKKKRKRSSEQEEDVEQLSSGAVAEPLNDDAETQKKKKKRKKEKRVIHAEASNSTLDQLEEHESCLENTAASQETLDSSCVKRKKHKKKKQSSSNDATQSGEEGGVDVSMSNDAATLAGKKKKKKIPGFDVCDGIDTSSGEVADKTQKATGDEDAELVTKKKKKKKEKKRMSEILSRHISDDTVAQSHDSASVREKEKKRASSFLAADAEGNCAQTNQDKSSPSQAVAVSAGAFETESAEMAGNLSVAESNDGVRKKKRKRKMSDKGHERDFEEPNETCQSDLPETTDGGVKRKKKRRREESEPVTPTESAADVECSQIDEAVVLKKKKKKKKKIKENPPTDIEDAESEIFTLTSHKKKQFASPLDPKGEHGHSAERSHDSRTSDQAAKETADIAAPEVPGSQTLNDVKDKKKKMKKKRTDNVLPEGQSLAESVELEPHKHKKKEKKERNNPTAVPSFISSSSMLPDTDSPSRFEMSSSNNISKNKRIKAKRRLYNLSEDFLMH